MRFFGGAALALLVSLLAGGSYAAPSHESLIAFSSAVDYLPRIHTVRPNGHDLRVRGRFTRRQFVYGEMSPAWSPDGRTLAFVRRRGCTPRTFAEDCFEVWTRRLDGSALRKVTRVTSAYSSDVDPAWSPNGRRIAFARERPARTEQGGTSASLYTVPAGGGAIRRITDAETYDKQPAWRPDGSAILFVRNPPNEFGEDQLKSRLMLVAPNGSALRPFGGGLRGSSPAWSPDGRRVAFTSYKDRNGRQCGRDYCRWLGELYVVNTDGTGLRRLTRNLLDESSATWSPDGQWIAFSSGRTEGTSVRYRIYRIPANGGRPTLVADMPRAARGPDWRPR